MPLDTPTSVTGLTEFFYIDTNKDGFVAPLDVLVVINFLNDPASNLEGEDEVLGLQVAAFSVPMSPSPTPLFVLAILQPASRAEGRVTLRENAPHNDSAFHGEVPQRTSPRLLATTTYDDALDEILANDSQFSRDALFELTN